MKDAIVFNGSTGGLGRHLQGQLNMVGAASATLKARLEDPDDLLQELDRLPPSLVDRSLTLIQLAALVSVARCEADPELAWKTNVTDTERTVEAFVRWSTGRGLVPRVVLVSSGHVYSPAEPGSRTRETDPVEPRSIYAMTKLGAEERLSEAARDLGFQLLIARVFGLVAPDQPSHYLLPALIERARRGDLTGIPGLTHVRDYLDARDVCRHLWNLTCYLNSARTPSPVLVNVCSGVPTTVGEVLDQVLRVVHDGRTSEYGSASSRVGGAPGRSTDLVWLVGDPERLETLSNSPAQMIPLSQSVRDAINAGI